jgi:methylated-DNA-protein-cysteine methyltransferase-like protein
MSTSSTDPKRQSILVVVRSIAHGEVRGYAEVARAAGLPRHARFVARVLTEAAEPDLPWHRVLRSDGRIAFEPGSRAALEQARRLRAEGLKVDGVRVQRSPRSDDLDSQLWAPPAR